MSDLSPDSGGLKHPVSLGQGGTVLCVISPTPAGNSRLGGGGGGEMDSATDPQPFEDTCVVRSLSSVSRMDTGWGEGGGGSNCA